MDPERRKASVRASRARARHHAKAFRMLRDHLYDNHPELMPEVSRIEREAAEIRRYDGKLS